MAQITEIEGIDTVFAKKLSDKGINTLEALLERCATPAGRKKLADETGLSGKLIIKWANRADLARIKGIGSEYADLLEAAGVDTVPELAQRNADNLYNALVAVNEAKRLVRRVPAESQVIDWINQAKALPRTLTY